MFEIVLVGLLTLYSVKAEKYKDNTREESGKKRTSLFNSDPELGIINMKYLLVSASISKEKSELSNGSLP